MRNPVLTSLTQGLRGAARARVRTFSWTSVFLLFNLARKKNSKKISAKLITTTKLSDVAYEIGEHLKIKIKQDFKLNDKYDLLDKGKEGVTLALIEKGEFGLKQETHNVSTTE